MEKDKKKKSSTFKKIGSIIFWLFVIGCLCAVLYKPFLNKIYIPYQQDKIKEETSGMQYEDYQNNLDKINYKLANDKNLVNSKNSKGKINSKENDYLNRWKYNDDSNLNNSYMGDYSNSNDLSDLDLTYDYSKVKPVNELDLSTLDPRYDKRLLTGRIAIPRLSLNLPILEGVSNNNLYSGAGTLKPYQKMGKGNYSLASHHMPDGYSLFSRIGQLQKGNDILLSDGRKIYRYSVSSVRTMPVNSSSVVDDVPGKKMVTLVTCNDIYGTARIVVQGELKSTYKMSSSYGKWFR